MLAFNDRAENGILSAEEARSASEITSGNGLANERAAHHLAIDAYRGNAIDGKIMMPSQIHQEVNVSLTSMAEGPGMTDRNATERLAGRDELLDESARWRPCGVLSEWTGQQTGDADLIEDELLVPQAAE